MASPCAACREVTCKFPNLKNKILGPSLPNLYFNYCNVLHVQYFEEVSSNIFESSLDSIHSFGYCLLGFIKMGISPTSQLYHEQIMFVTWFKADPLHSLKNSAFYLKTSHHLGPRYEGQLMSDGGVYSPFRSIFLVLTHDFIITCVYGPTGSDGHEWMVPHHFGSLGRRECCMLGAPSSQPTVPLHELPPARPVIHRQTSAHERCKWTRSVQSRSGILAHLCTQQHWLWVTVEPQILVRATRRLLLGREVATLLYAEFRARNN